MEDALIAAMLQCRVAEAQLTLESMRAANLVQLSEGKTPAYNEEAYLEAINDLGITHNSVQQLINDMRS